MALAKELYLEGGIGRVESDYVAEEIFAVWEKRYQTQWFEREVVQSPEFRQPLDSPSQRNVKAF